MKCPKCEFDNPEGFEFCGKCGQSLEGFPEVEEAVPSIKSERKYVTVLFSDLTGYTTISDKLDPEEVKEITSQILGEISKIVEKYDGFIEKYAGDAVMAIFGVPKAHEDDPIRAVKSALEIHELVDAISPEVEKRIGQPISMHTGINTGLVVTGEVDIVRGTHGVAGDTINVASRLSNLAEAGQILVDEDTFRQAEGYFTFESLEPVTLKGKEELLRVHKFLALRENPVTIRRLSGLRADLVGRKKELAVLYEAVENMREGRGRIFSICGDAGTGKSRLVEEFKSTIDLEEIQWLEGHAYAYAQNIPYFPMIDLLNMVFQIKESDTAESVKKKLESKIEQLVGKDQNIIPYVGSLYSLSYQELDEVSPEFWKTRLKEATQIILTALAKRAPTVFFLEDLHWADSSFVELLRHACLKIRQPAVVLCVYRPTFNLFTSHQVSGLGQFYHEIQLKDLSRSESQEMVQLLLKTENIPLDLRQLVHSKAEGNPFYLEELINSLIESKTLVRDNGNWKITKQIAEADMPSSIHGLISGRIDRLEKETKRILQEASVIGRTFLFEILKKITELKDRIEGKLSFLERLDLIRIRSLRPDLEYMFKHPLTQEVIYNGLLKKERREIHEQIALVMEQLFHDRLPEFYETLAFHFSRGQSVNKAVDYLVKSGEKSLERFTVEEAHQYFKMAFELLDPKEVKSEDDKIIIVDIMNSWGYSYYYRAEIKEFMNLFNSYKGVAESLDDHARLGMFYVWFGISIWMAGKSKDAYEYLCKARELGEKSGNQKVIGYACTWLTWACWELGLYAEGIESGERAQKIAKSFPADQYLFFKSLGALSQINFMKGETQQAFNKAKRLLEYGEKTSNNTSTVFGHWLHSWGYLLTGDLESSQKWGKKTIEVALDPLYSQFPKYFIAYTHLLGGQLQEAEDLIDSLIGFCEPRSIGFLSVPSYLILGLALIAKGRMKQGLRMLEESQHALIGNQRRTWYGVSEYILGSVYAQIATGPTPAFSIIIKNIGFLIKNVPFAGKKADKHLNNAIEILREIGAKGFLGGAYLDLGLFYKAKKKDQQARECLSEAISLFKQCEAEVYIKQANEALESLESSS